MLPALSVDLHVYSPEPAQRFMVISGQRAQEGATVAGGVVIEKITPDGAIAVFRGTRFLLTRE
jgi:general secretion pathway protein B